MVLHFNPNHLTRSSFLARCHCSSSHCNSNFKMSTDDNIYFGNNICSKKWKHTYSIQMECTSWYPINSIFFVLISPFWDEINKNLYMWYVSLYMQWSVIVMACGRDFTPRISCFTPVSNSHTSRLGLYVRRCQRSSLCKLFCGFNVGMMVMPTITCHTPDNFSVSM